MGRNLALGTLATVGDELATCGADTEATLFDVLSEEAEAFRVLGPDEVEAAATGFSVAGL